MARPGAKGEQIRNLNNGGSDRLERPIAAPCKAAHKKLGLHRKQRRSVGGERTAAVSFDMAYTRACPSKTAYIADGSRKQREPPPDVTRIGYGSNNGGHIGASRSRAHRARDWGEFAIVVVEERRKEPWRWLGHLLLADIRQGTTTRGRPPCRVLRGRSFLSIL